MTKEEHSKILAIFKKHKVYTSEDLNKIAKRKTFERFKKFFSQKKVKKLDYRGHKKDYVIYQDFYNEVRDQRLLFPEFLIHTIKKR